MRPNGTHFGMRSGDCRLSLRERTLFRGAKGDKVSVISREASRFSSQRKKEDSSQRVRQALFSSTTPHRSCQAWRRSRRDNSRSWLWSVFNWRLRSSGRSGMNGCWTTDSTATIGTRSSDSTATIGARSSSNGIAAGSWSSIAVLPFSLAAPGPRSLAALDPCWLAAATSFRNTTHREHNTKRHRQTKQTVHSDLLRS